MKRILSLLLILAGLASAPAGPNDPVVQGGATSGTVGVAFTYQIVVSSFKFPISSYSAAPLPAGLSVNATTGVISGTPTAAGVTTATICATDSHGNQGCNTLVITIVVPNFVGFRLPDFPASTGSGANVLTLQMGANGTTATANRFNATLEVQLTDPTSRTTYWVPYNRFVGISDAASWITDAPLPVRNSGATGAPQAFSTDSTQLTQSPPAVYMKADPRSTRFGIFQIDTNPTTRSRIVLSLWPSADTHAPNGFGGTIGTTFPAPVEYAPLRFNGNPYYPATLSINGPVDSRDNATTTYADNDGVTRPADAIYSDGTSGTGSSTPYYTGSTAYRPVILNRPFRSVGELGYVFRDLPWKTLDLFSQNSADAGLLDVFCIHDGPQSATSYDGTNFGTVVPSMVAGKINLNTQQAGGLQAMLAGAIWDDGLTFSTVSNTGSPSAQSMAAQITAAATPTPYQNKTEIITRTSLPTTILPVAATDNQSVKAQREVVPRAISSVSQTRVWNLLIDVVAQSGHYPPTVTANPQSADLPKFIVEGQQHYWVHVAIDRFTGQVIDKQIEVVNE